MAIRDSILMFFAYTKKYRPVYCQTIRSVRDISRDDRAIIATCSLRTPTDRQADRLNENYSIDSALIIY